MKSLITIIISCLLALNSTYAEDNQSDRPKPSNNEKSITADPKQDRIQAEKRAQLLNKKMATKTGEMNDIMQQQISIRFGFELDE